MSLTGSYSPTTAMGFEDDKFPEAAQEWDLQRLYTDLENAKQQLGAKNKKKLTPLEKACLRGLLCGCNPQTIATVLNQSPGGLRVSLTNGLYRYVENLTHRELNQLKNWREVAEWLAEAGYKGKLPPQDFYIKRPPIESHCDETILQPGALIRIKAPKKMGKTLLMDKIYDYAKKQGYHTVHLDLLLADGEVLSNLYKFLRWFCASVSRELHLPNQLDKYWDEDLGSNSNCKNYFEEYLLVEKDNPLVLGLDNVDRVFSSPTVAPDFFGLLRACHEAGNRGEIWQKLRLVVAYSTEVYIPLNINQSPFNVGIHIELPEFTVPQVQELAQRHGLNLDTLQVRELMDMLGGHPYLIQQAFSHLKTHLDRTLQDLLKTAPTEAGLYSEHLRKHLLTIQKDPEMVAVMKKVVDAINPVRLEVEQAFKLESMGLVHKQGNEVKLRCTLYRLYFKDRLEVP